MLCTCHSLCCHIHKARSLLPTERSILAGVRLRGQLDIVHVDIHCCHLPLRVESLGIKMVHEEQVLVIRAARLVLASAVDIEGVSLPKRRAVFKLVLVDEHVVSAESAGMAGPQKQVVDHGDERAELQCLHWVLFRKHYRVQLL